jgi:hypothetical protein
LGGDPFVEVVGAVEDAAAEAEAAGSGAEVPPVAQGGFGGAEDARCFVDREEIVVVPLRVLVWLFMIAPCDVGVVVAFTWDR